MKITEFRENLVQSWFCEFLNTEIDIAIELGEGDAIEDFEAILENVLFWKEEFFKKLEPMLFAYCDETLAMCGEDYPSIENERDVWKSIHIGSIMLHSHEGNHYAMASGGCEWEQEHGLEFDVDITNQVLYLGAFISNGFYEDPNNPSTYNFVKGNV